MENIFLVLGMILNLTMEAQKLGVVIENARANGRDINDIEMKQIKDRLALAKTRLRDAIENYDNS